MAFSIKELNAKIKAKCESSDDAEYLKNAIAIIDDELQRTPVDEVFIGEYYKLKRNMIFHSEFFATVILGSLVGVIGSFAISLFDYFDITETSRHTDLFIRVAVLVAVIFGFVICGWLILNYINRTNSVRDPYLAKKMEDAILNSPIQYTEPRRGKQKKIIIQRIRQLVENHKLILVVIFLVSSFLVLYVITSNIHRVSLVLGSKGYKTICVSSLIAGIVISLANIIKRIVPQWWKNWKVIFWVIVITMAIPVIIHYGFFEEDTFTQENLLSAYTEYLSFVGAFALGYFLYKREEIKNFEVLKKKARLIYESMQYIQLNLKNLDAFVERGETYPIDGNWRSDYLDVKPLVKYEESALGDELRYFFSTIESINKAIVAGDKSRAQKIHSNFIQKETHAFSPYNHIEAGTVILNIALDLPQQKTWKEKEKDQIEKYAADFFDVVNWWINNYLIRNHLSMCDLSLMECELVEWLLQHPELNAWVKNSYEKRKISAVIFEIALSMKEKSPNLNYCWGAFSRK